MSYAGNGRRLVLGLKHGDRLDLAPTFARWMASRAAPLVTEDMILVPVPIHWSRLLKRRYNQSAVLTRLMSGTLGLPHGPDILVRIKATKPQSGDIYDDRAANIADAIIVNPRRTQDIAGKHVLLIDDVMTSGATLTACSLQLQKNHVRKISTITLARAAQHF